MVLRVLQCFVRRRLRA